MELGICEKCENEVDHKNLKFFYVIGKMENGLFF